MGFFKRSKVESSSQLASTPPMGSGRRLRSSQSIEACLGTIEALVDSYRPRQYPHLPPYDVTGFLWIGDGPEPDAVVNFADVSGDFILAAFWSGTSDTEFGLFPLGAGDERLATMSVIGNWKMLDRSLSSIGQVPHGQILLERPDVPDDLIQHGLRLAGYPVTPRNVQLFGDKVAELALLKAMQFIASVDQGAAERFADTHPRGDADLTTYLQGVLDDLAAWNPGLLPYIQDIPTRVRALMLESLDQNPGTLALER